MRFLGESLVYILRENSNCTEESTGYWVIHSFGLFIRIRLWALIDLTFELNKDTDRRSISGATGFAEIEVWTYLNLAGAIGFAEIQECFNCKLNLLD